MTDIDLLAFRDSLTRLGRVMGKAVTADLVEDYFADLREFPLESVNRALDHVRKTSKFWPRPSVIREACVLVPGVATLTQVPVWVDPVSEKWFCGACWDTGFTRGLECPGDGTCRIAHCGQVAGQTTVHAYTRRCSCVATNPVLLRERDIQRRRTAPSQDRS